DQATGSRCRPTPAAGRSRRATMARRWRPRRRRPRWCPPVPRSVWRASRERKHCRPRGLTGCRRHPVKVGAVWMIVVARVRLLGAFRLLTVAWLTSRPARRVVTRAVTRSVLLLPIASLAIVAQTELPDRLKPGAD